MKKTTSIRILAVAIAAAISSPAFALPSGGAFVAGAGNISTSGSTMTITATGPGTGVNPMSGAGISPINGKSSAAVIDWSGGFRVGNSETVDFVRGTQNVSAWINVDTSGQLSNVNGTIGSDGAPVMLINPNGVSIGANATLPATVPVVAVAGNYNQSSGEITVDSAPLIIEYNKPLIQNTSGNNILRMDVTGAAHDASGHAVDTLPWTDMTGATDSTGLNLNSLATIYGAAGTTSESLTNPNHNGFGFEQLWNQDGWNAQTVTLDLGDTGNGGAAYFDGADITNLTVSGGTDSTFGAVIDNSLNSPSIATSLFRALGGYTGTNTVTLSGVTVNSSGGAGVGSDIINIKSSTISAASVGLTSESGVTGSGINVDTQSTLNSTGGVALTGIPGDVTTMNGTINATGNVLFDETAGYTSAGGTLPQSDVVIGGNVNSTGGTIGIKSFSGFDVSGKLNGQYGVVLDSQATPNTAPSYNAASYGTNVITLSGAQVSAPNGDVNVTADNSINLANGAVVNANHTNLDAGNTITIDSTSEVMGSASGQAASGIQDGSIFINGQQINFGIGNRQTYTGSLDVVTPSPVTGTLHSGAVYSAPVIGSSATVPADTSISINAPTVRNSGYLDAGMIPVPTPAPAPALVPAAPQPVVTASPAAPTAPAIQYVYVNPISITTTSNGSGQPFMSGSTLYVPTSTANPSTEAPSFVTVDKGQQVN